MHLSIIKQLHFVNAAVGAQEGHQWPKEGCIAPELISVPKINMGIESQSAEILP